VVVGPGLDVGLDLVANGLASEASGMEEREGGLREQGGVALSIYKTTGHAQTAAHEELGTIAGPDSGRGTCSKNAR
jgi:hypothetical protein